MFVRVLFLCSDKEFCISGGMWWVGGIVICYDSFVGLIEV